MSTLGSSLTGNTTKARSPRTLQQQQGGITTTSPSSGGAGGNSSRRSPKNGGISNTSSSSATEKWNDTSTVKRFLWSFLALGVLVCCLDNFYCMYYMLSDSHNNQQQPKRGNNGMILSNTVYEAERQRSQLLLRNLQQQQQAQQEQGAQIEPPQQQQEDADVSNTDTDTDAGDLQNPDEDAGGNENISENNNNNNQENNSNGEAAAEQQEEEGAEEAAAVAAAAAAPDNVEQQQPPELVIPKGKERLVLLLQDAKVNIDQEIIDKLPTWHDVTRLYGNEPVYYGLDSCQRFQTTGDPAEHFVSTAGTFNTGTNLMAELLIANCHMPARMQKYGRKNKGIRWQVLWGKHTPVGDEDFRLHHKTYNDSALTAENIFPAVTVRDPYKWMQSMCRHPYGAKWYHNITRHCPNLVPNEEDRQEFPLLADKKSIQVHILYKEFIKWHHSMADFWSRWYHDYTHAPFPRLIVRFEDLIFHPKNVTQTVCECAGGQLNPGRFRYIVESAKRGTKAHGDPTQRTTYVDAILRYGTEEGRYNGFEPADLKFARKALAHDLMKSFGYPYAPDNLEGQEEEEENENNNNNNAEEEEEVNEAVVDEKERNEQMEDLKNGAAAENNQWWEAHEARDAAEQA